MQTTNQYRSRHYALASALIACVTILTCEAAGHFNRSNDSGQPRELINQPVCWAFEVGNDPRPCDVAEFFQG
jgi:hypothetical protein